MDLFDAKARIQILRNQLDYFAGEYKKDPMAQSLGLPQERRYRTTDPLKTLDILQRFETLRDTLRRENPDLFSDLPVRPLPDPTTEVPGANNGRGGILPTTSAKWLSDMDYCVELITAIEQRPAQSVKVTREGIYFAGQTFDALLSFHEIISAAKQHITLIDGYIDERLLNLLTAKAAGVTVEILTLPSVPASVRAAVPSFRTQYGDLNIRAPTRFHDRFVIIDDTDFYHFGASIKDLANRGFMFSKIEEKPIIDALRAEYAREWAAASVVV